MSEWNFSGVFIEGRAPIERIEFEHITQTVHISCMYICINKKSWCSQ